MVKTNIIRIVVPDANSLIKKTKIVEVLKRGIAKMLEVDLRVNRVCACDDFTKCLLKLQGYS